MFYFFLLSFIHTGTIAVSCTEMWDEMPWASLFVSGGKTTLWKTGCSASGSTFVSRVFCNSYLEIRNNPLWITPDTLLAYGIVIRAKDELQSVENTKTSSCSTTSAHGFPSWSVLWCGFFLVFLFLTLFVAKARWVLLEIKKSKQSWPLPNCVEYGSLFPSSGLMDPERVKVQHLQKNLRCTLELCQ